MAFPLQRRALPTSSDADGSLIYQLDSEELEQLRDCGAELDDIAAYLELTFMPGTGVDEETLKRLDALSQLVGN
jgi:hypothetical protein